MKAKVREYKKRDYMGLVYITPWLVGFLLLQLYPFVASLFYSFTQYNIMSAPSFVGLNNYITLFKADTEFWNSLKVTIIFTLYTVPGKLVMALLIALLMSKQMKGINMFRTIYYIPSLFGGSVAVAILWKLMFMDDGVINSLLTSIHLPTVQWLGNPNTSLKTICLLEMWQFGSSMVMFLAALKQVPQSLYEAAQIDGAGKLRCFLKITIPQITPIIFFNLIMQTINALQSFTSAFVITKGGPLKSTYVLGMKLYNEAFKNYKLGYASAISWVIFILIMAVTLLLFRSSSGWVYYEDSDEF
jgi:oligogalacturonide transport system permease protein